MDELRPTDSAEWVATLPVGNSAEDRFVELLRGMMPGAVITQTRGKSGRDVVVTWRGVTKRYEVKGDTNETSPNVVVEVSQKPLRGGEQAPTGVCATDADYYVMVTRKATYVCVTAMLYGLVYGRTPTPMGEGKCTMGVLVPKAVLECLRYVKTYRVEWTPPA